jgi:hypothetical protein
MGGLVLTGEHRSTGRKTCHSGTLSTTNLTWTDLSSNLPPCGEGLATNSLSHGKAILKLRGGGGGAVRGTALIITKCKRVGKLRGGAALCF